MLSSSQSASPCKLVCLSLSTFFSLSLCYSVKRPVEASVDGLVNVWGLEQSTHLAPRILAGRTHAYARDLEDVTLGHDLKDDSQRQRSCLSTVRDEAQEVIRMAFPTDRTSF